MKKQTKKDYQITTFAKYGIEYDYSANKILAPWGNWIPLLIPTNTNSKVGNAGTWSIRHGNETFNAFEMHETIKKLFETVGIESITGSCPYHCKGCYCDFGRYNFKDNQYSLFLKLIVARFYSDFMVRAICAQIKAFNITQIRIHAAGDFFSAEYVDAWITIAENNPDVIFWTYTKFEYALKRFESVKNVFITPSLTPFGFNFGKCKYILETREKLLAMGKRVHVCACGTEYQKHCSDCSHGCKSIGIDTDYVLFIEHSTGYKAGKKDRDDYNALIAIIAAQNNN